MNIDRYIYSNKNSDTDEINKIITQLSKCESEINQDSKDLWEITKHLEGMFVGPVLTSIGMSNFFSDELNNSKEINIEILKDKFPTLSRIIKYFHKIDWFSFDQNKYFLTEIGEFYFKRSRLYFYSINIS